MAEKLTLNCDLGEADALHDQSPEHHVMPYIDMANIACGFHAGNRQVMRDTVTLAKAHNVAIGAHPSYPDRENFGRRSMQLGKADICDLVTQQIELLDAICDEAQTKLHHIKPHGALYHDMMQHEQVLQGILEALRHAGYDVPLLMMATADNDHFRKKADSYGIEIWFEAFADRRYTDETRLASRDTPGAVLSDPQLILAQAQALAAGEPIISETGKALAMDAQTLCVHGDNKHAVAVVKAIRQAFGGR